MKHTHKCPECQSTKIIADAKVVDRGESNFSHDMEVATFRKPQAWIFKGKQSTTVSAWVCVNCGYVAFYADDPGKLVVQ